MFTYVIQQGTDGPIKIGQSTDPHGRIRRLQTGSPYPLRVVAIFTADELSEEELHARFCEERMLGEWFEATPAVMDSIWAARCICEANRADGYT